jgi:hypothetical protein
MKLSNEGTVLVIDVPESYREMFQALPPDVRKKLGKTHKWNHLTLRSLSSGIVTPQIFWGY